MEPGTGASRQTLPGTEVSISVVICAHTLDRFDLLRAAIASVQAQSFRAAEVILVCDHNEDLCQRAESEFSGVRVVQNTRSKGLTGARNTGLAVATGSVIAFLDDDARAEETWLETLSRPYADPTVMAVGGGIVPVWPETRPRWFPREFDWVIGCSYLGQPDGGGAVRNLIGCNMSFRRDVSRLVGDFRDGLGRVGDNAAGCEETDYFIRMHKAFPTRTVYLEPRALVHHAVSAKRASWRYLIQRCRAEGRAKADLVAYVGRAHGLSSETNYARKVLPAGVGRGLADGLRGDAGGFGRAAAICAGFLAVSTSYVSRRIFRTLAKKRPEAEFHPYRIVDIELSRDLPTLQCRDPETGRPYSAAWCLVRLHGRPIKVLEVLFEGDDIAPEKLAQLVAADSSEAQSTDGHQADESHEPLVSVIVATRNRAESLRRCLDSLLTQTYGNYEIVVVDNAPSDEETAKLIARSYATTGRVTYVREDIAGLARAHNTGVRHSSGELLAFTDDDVIADSRWISSIASNFLKSEAIGCVTGMILPAELVTQAQLWTERHGGFGKGLSRRVFDIRRRTEEAPLFPYAAGAFGSGANMAFRRTTLQKMGGFDNALGAGTIARGGDDLASFVSALKTGDQLAYEPGAIVWHFHRRDFEGMRRQAYGYGVGLGAFLTKQVVEDPRQLAFFARRLPAAIRHLFSRTSEKMSRLPDDYPGSLVWAERLGILVGVPSYIRSRLKARASSFPEAPDASS